MTEKIIRRADLIKGGNIIKQGETFTLGFRLYDGAGRIIQLETADIVTVKIANKSGVIHETTATKVDDTIEFTVSESIGWGQMRVELTVTNGTNIQKYPARDWINLTITPSLDDVGIGGVQAVTATQMFARIDAAETTSTTAETKSVAAETTANSVKARFDEILAETGDSNPEIVDARGGAVNLGARLDETAAQLAEKATKTEVALKADKTEVQAIASGSPKGTYATVTALQTAFPTGNTNIYLVLGNVKEVASLNVTAIPTTAGNVTVTLNGVAVNIAIDPAVDTTTTLVATKIRNAIYTGWTTGGTGSTVTFTATVGGAKTDSTFNAGTTGATGTISTTTQGVDADGKWYYWNGSAWTSGGVYQSAGLGSNVVNPQNTTFISQLPNLMDKSKIVYSSASAQTGILDSTFYDRSDYIPVFAGQTLTFSQGIRYVTQHNPDTTYNKIINSADKKDIPYTFTPDINGFIIGTFHKARTAEIVLNKGLTADPLNSEFGFVLDQKIQLPSGSLDDYLAEENKIWEVV